MMKNTSCCSSIIFSLLFVLFLFDAAVTLSSASSVESECAKTSHPKVCVKAIRSDPRGSRGDPAFYTMAEIILDAVDKNAKLGEDRSKRYYNEARAGSRLRKSLRLCSNMYKNARSVVYVAREDCLSDQLVSDWTRCEEQFPAGQSPLTSVNRHGKKLSEVAFHFNHGCAHLIGATQPPPPPLP